MLPVSKKMSFNWCRLKDIFKKICIVSIFILLCNLQINGQVPSLGTTFDFALFTASGAFNNVGASTVVTGDVGTNVGAFNAFPPGTLNGSSHVADVVTAQAAVDVMTAYSYLDGLTCGLVIGTTLGSGQILTPNIYCLGGASTINGDLVLDGQGDPDAIFIFQIDGALSTTTLSSVTLINSASLCNVFWQINGAVSLGERSLFEGTMLVQGAISLLQQATLNGRGLSTAGAISLADNVVNIASSSSPVASIITASGTTNFCQGDSVTLSGNTDGVWSNGLSTPSIIVRNSGDYYVINSNNCGSDTSNHILVTVSLDTMSPVIACPSNITITLDQDVCSSNVIFPLATVIDNCSSNTEITLSSDVMSGTIFSVGTTIVTFSAADLAGNTSECSFDVIINDLQAPEIICPASTITVNAGLDSCSTIVTFEITATDNCTANPTIEPIGSLESGSEFFAGSNIVTYQATDFVGNTATCEFIVQVIDTQAPVFNTCPSDTIINLAASECGIVFSFSTPMDVTENCELDTIIQIGGPASDSLLAVGTYEITFEAIDTSGNSSLCSFTVTVNDFVNRSLGCKPVHLSLDSNCEGTLTPTQVLTGWEHASGIPQIGCDTLYKINILSSTGDSLGDTADRTLLGKTLDYTISHPSGFTCWNTVLIEDKMAPTVTCRDTSVNCLTDLTKVVVAFADDNCNARLVLVNEVHGSLDCDPLYIGTVTRTYKAVDDYGNESAPCTATINLERSTNMGIVPPNRNPKLSCSSGYDPDDKGFGFPHPSETGIPTFDGRNLWPQRELDVLYCNAVIDYTDDLLIDTDCKKRIRRTWTITEWWCSTSVQLFLGIQMIDIIDETAPVIPQQSNIQVTTQSRSCTASVLLPTLVITDNCNDVYKVYVNANDGNPSGFVNGNGGLIDLEVGTHTITYTAFDECSNSSTMQYRITVKDDTDPVAICDQFATVSLKTDGYTEVTAKAVDDGSFDECGAVTLQIRRMEDPCGFFQDTSWHDKVGFCCLDANTTRMVQLLVTDKGLNTNICMVSVNVQEKVEPTITCPADLTIENCSFTFDPSLSGANSAFGAAIINDNCPANNTLGHVLVDNRSQCGTGTVVRTFSINQSTALNQTCTQIIEFRNNDPFYINRLNNNDPNDDVTWPADYTAIGQCTPIGLDPAMTGRPIISEDACDMVGLRMDDLTFPFTTNGVACYKIVRTWTVMDWCQTDEFGNNLTWTYEQEIKVMDNDAPVITVPTSPVIYETLSCYSDKITLSASAMDCTPQAELRWEYVITQEGDVVSEGNTNTVVDSFEVGEYTISYTVEDRCGNISSASYDFVVETTKSPTAVCKQGLASPLVLMNVGGGNVLMTMIPAEFFDNKSYHTCKYDFDLSFSSDINNDTISFNTPGCKIIQLWVTDENGNTSFCETFVDVQLNGVENNCQGSPLLSTVAGRTVKENNEEIEAVVVEMLGSEQDPVITNASGAYTFGPMSNGGTYQIKPGKDGDDMNGVSTLDIVMIQRHILGLEKLKTPYQLIAADANNSGSVTAGDLTEIRKLILGNIPSFTNNTSWRFIDAAYAFPEPKDPWTGNLAEQYFIDQLSHSMDVNFIGVKVGDVNGTAKGRNISNGDTETRSTAALIIDDRKVMSGEIMEIAVMADNNATIYGMQAQWLANGLIIRDIKEKSVKVDADAFSINAINSANMSISLPNGTRVAENKAMFIIEVEVLRSGQLSEMLTLGDDMTSELYTSDMDARRLVIDWRSETLSNFALSQVTPNPWHAQTQITFEMPKDGMVSFKVKDYTGKKVISTIDQYQAGMNTIQLNRSDIGQSGVYVYELRYEDKVITGKMILIE
jgi:hypothetical protein